MTRLGYAALAVVVVWVAVILATTLVLRDTPYLGSVLLIHGGGAAISLGVLGGALRQE